MGIIQTIKNMIGISKPVEYIAHTSTIDPEAISTSYKLSPLAPQDVIRNLGRATYITMDLDASRPSCDVVRDLTQDVDLRTVFVCGGYATFLAGYTTLFGDIDLFCTSKVTFCDIADKLEDKKDMSPTVVKGSCDGYTINIVYCETANGPEDIMDSFDMTWCRVAVDLQENYLVVHPDADSTLPILDASRLQLTHITKESLIKRVFERYCKYKERRVKPCPTSDGAIYELITEYVTNYKPAKELTIKQSFDSSYFTGPVPQKQISQKTFDNSY